ncbi:GlxA family transcriptional regulator [Acinetobacter bouvetii]|uniref:HTH-type transcriptional regulator CdhR n=1 Tax=Acinetobacter bouvetii TaxID=202951 RepID=A0A811GDW1_9GAMM|nr:helix-turn-helix domain-containing protein [Acinetobacter bouvetii]CAB1221802.1 HTH-type transcriptional regulator CdhR [Acinetobacter bouvetii]
MIQVIILGFDGALASAITGVLDLFSMAGVSWNRIQKQQVQRLFNVNIATANGHSIQCINGLKIEAHLVFKEIKAADLIVIPTIAAPIDTVLAQNAELIEFLLQAYHQNWLIAGNCTGNFFLAEAGLLDDKQATTHWGFKDIFQQRYPKVQLKADQLITQDGHIYCAGGGLAWFDLGLHLIDRFYGFETAIHTAKSFVLDYRRDNQLSYSLMRISKPHQDALIKEIQNWLEQHYAEQFTLDDLAQQFNVTVRTLIRRFKAVLDIPPNHYLQAIRIEAAQKKLEETELPIDLVMQQVGYQDPSSFRRLFRKKTGLTPLDYRRRFSRRF